MSLKFEVRDANGLPVIGVNTSLPELQAKRVARMKAGGEYQKHCSLEVTLPWIVRYRLAILFFCTLAGMLSQFHSSFFPPFKNKCSICTSFEKGF